MIFGSGILSMLFERLDASQVIYKLVQILEVHTSCILTILSPGKNHSSERRNLRKQIPVFQRLQVSSSGNITAQKLAVLRDTVTIKHLYKDLSLAWQQGCITNVDS